MRKRKDIEKQKVSDKLSKVMIGHRCEPIEQPIPSTSNNSGDVVEINNFNSEIINKLSSNTSRPNVSL